MTDLTSILPTLVEQTGIMLGIVALSLAFGGIGGLVIGTGLYVTRRGGILQQGAVWWVLNVLVNTVRPIPFIILLAAVQPLGRIVVGTGIGTEYAIFAISLAATFGIARIVEQNLVSIPTGVIEAARATGASPWRIIRTVILPEALGPLVLGFTFAVIAIVDMSAVAGLVGGEGLGNWAVTYGYRQFDEVVTWSALIVVVIVVQLIQALGNWLARRIMRR
ncbi:ABC transporter permease [Agrococcus lahaulensis]|jgi:D-methionine transport system permease protein|uniref:methionine ABC transporter permease n=1 Tax=Agrococcus sp. BE272 TaxID=2817727 RepID=UPI000FE2C751|nr:methionine ABC transporter permease [Agrococcus sp. BE272]MDR7233094.1 D-methionine transport system permease protein [Agrococcus sp. BE272]RWR17451.1 ABC transporter permease [Agrococcus lahaulensis]